MTLKELFDEEFKDIKFDNNLANFIHKYQVKYLMFNKEHIEFFGGNLLGVNIIRFTDSYINILYDELNIDSIDLNKKLLKVKGINKDFKISSDLFNNVIMYITHRWVAEGNNKAAYDTVILFFYRTIAALISNVFRYTANKKIIDVAYSKLNKKNLIKKLGSWGEVMKYRSTELLSKDSIHKLTLLNYNDVDKVVYLINDSQGRVRDSFKNYYSVIVETQEEGSLLIDKSSVIKDINGEEVLSDYVHHLSSKIAYIHSIILDEKSFIKNDLMNIVVDINTNTSKVSVIDSLSWIHNNYNGTNTATINKFIDNTMIHSLNAILTFTDVNKNDLVGILIRLKNSILSSRSQSKELLTARKLGLKIIKKTLKARMSMLLSVRTSVMIYIILRVLVSDKI